jgi:hypothetical protein
MSTPRPIATVSVDLDDLWAYLRVRGDAHWEDAPSLLGRAVPRLLDLMHARNLTATFFIVGRDAARDDNTAILRQICEAGHEIGNHSFDHRPSFAQGSEDDIDRELAGAEQAIEHATGVRPTGFRGPGFSLSPALLRVLARREYVYDASTFPSIVGPLARMYYRFTVGQARTEDQATLYGGWTDGFQPLHPYRWRTPGPGLLEVPVTTFPLLRLPIHQTYVAHLATRAPRVALSYLGAALASCRLTRTAPSFLLHAIDVLGGDDVPELSAFPGMPLSGSRKVDLLAEALDRLTKDFDVLPMDRFVKSLATAGHRLPSREC